jgi:hypothetical protein
MLRYTQALITQMAQTAVCNRHHTIDQQLCRWLLLSLDRLRSNELTMTQELIANMLGVRREGVTEAAGKLQRLGVIDYHRGQIEVLDRKKLETLSCECYAVVKEETDRLLPYVKPGWRETGSAPFGAAPSCVDAQTRPRRTPRSAHRAGVRALLVPNWPSPRRRISTWLPHFPPRLPLAIQHAACRPATQGTRAVPGPVRAVPDGVWRRAVRRRHALPACLLPHQRPDLAGVEPA